MITLNINLETYQLTLIIIASVIVFLYLLYFLITLISLIIFRYKLKERSNSINMLMNDRKDIVGQIISFLEKKKIKVNEVHKQNVANLSRVEDFQKLSKKDRDSKIMDFMYSSSTIISLISQNEKIYEDDNYQELLLMYKDVEDAYRQGCAYYNSDVTIYNYWANLFGLKHIMHLFGFKTKDKIL